MTRYINPESGSNFRNKLLKSIVITIREHGKHSAVDEDTKDMIAFIILSLQKITDSIDDSITAWEKRDYWIKADHLRLEWEWAIDLSSGLYQALEEDDWNRISSLIISLALKCKNIRLPSKPNSSKLWIGAYGSLMRSRKKGAV